MAMIPTSWLAAAEKRLTGHIQKTPLTHDPSLEVYFKWENRQTTGSFKVRGAINKVLCLEDWERKRGLAAASAGNHGLGVALAGKICGAAVTVFTPENAPPVKLEAISDLGADLRLVPGGYAQAEHAGLDFAQKTKATWVSPYNDGQIIAGQATLGLECLRQLPGDVAYTWVVPVGGGGLLAGVCAALAAQEKETGHRVVGVQSQASPFFYALYHRQPTSGIIELPSLADGLAGAIETSSLTIPIAQSAVDDVILVSEDDIRTAIVHAWHHYHERIEGSAAASLAAILSGKISDRPAVVIITGGNIQPQAHDTIIEADFESERRN